MQYELSVVIPARSEEFLQRTIDDVLEHTSDRTEIIAILDGYLPNPPLKESSRVTVIYNPESKGQRTGCNQAVKLSKAKYIMKLDAHCAVDEDFDTKMIKAMEELGEDVTLMPIMRNLHAFDWICKNGHRRYQSPSGVCETCKLPTTKDVVWIAKGSPQSTSFRFDKNMHFQYYNEWARKQTGDYIESMSIQGSCYMTTRKKYMELDLTSEEFNSWGQNGVEVACKTWMSGGRVMCNRKTWYAHMFRTRGGDFGFPYHNPQSKVEENREKTKYLFRDDNWPKATRKFQWILDKFNPPEWTIRKGIIYYTHNQLDEKIAKPVRDQLQKISDEKKIDIVSSSLKKMNFGVKNVRFPTLKPGELAMAKQILGALENSHGDIIFFTEHDCLYPPEHFDFTPPSKDKFYYNRNFWKLRITDGHAVHFDADQLSGLCAYKDLLITEYRKIYNFIEKNGFTIRTVSFEPGTRDGRSEFWKSTVPIVDIRHGKNLTKEKWSQDDFRDKSTCQGWLESENYQIPGWDSSFLIKTFKI
jgi:glycosyltransferase involved in cell wall biosynthesis